MISTATFFDRARADMDRLRSQAQNYQRQISTGKRLEAGSDDPVAAAQLRRLAREDALATTDQRIAGQLKTDLQASDNTLSNVTNLLQRARTLALSAANGTLSEGDRANIGTEIAELRKSLLARANQTDSRGNALFGGKGAGAAYSEDASGTASYQGTANSGELDVGDGIKMQRGITGPEVFSYKHEGVQTDIFKTLGDLASTLMSKNANGAEEAKKAAGSLSSGLESVSKARVVVGAALSSLELHTDRQADAKVTRTEQSNALGGADIATAVTHLQQTMTALQASQASFVRLSELNLFALLR